MRVDGSPTFSLAVFFTLSTLAVALLFSGVAAAGVGPPEEKTVAVAVAVHAFFAVFGAACEEGVREASVRQGCVGTSARRVGGQGREECVGGFFQNFFGKTFWQQNFLAKPGVTAERENVFFLSRPGECNKPPTYTVTPLCTTARAPTGSWHVDAQCD